MMVDRSEGQSTPAGKATAEDPAGQGKLLRDTSHAEKVFSFFKEAVFASEEAEALPAESDCPQRKSTCTYVAQFIDFVLKRAKY